jgi:periplasmic protein TonB
MQSVESPLHTARVESSPPAMAHEQAVEPSAAAPTPSAAAEPLAPAPASDPQPQDAALAPASVSAPVKPDYGWLSEMIVRRVEELKRYPADARLEQAQGKVVVKAVINEDGSVSNAEVVKSSGFRSLDQAALDLMRHAGPFNLPRPLGKSSLAIRVPINYSIDRS